VGGSRAGGGKAPVPTRIVHGFTTQLPGRSRRFWQRQFFANYPRPIQAAGGTPFPRSVTIASIEAPKRQSIVIREVAFKAYQHSGLGIEDLAELPRGRAIGTLGFTFTKGNQGLTDFSTNLPGTGLPVQYTAAQGATASAPRAGQGNTFQGTGVATPKNGPDPFASYAMPGDNLIASAVIFRPPSFDLRLFEVQISGWLAEEKELEAIIDSLSR
jgi:hypothetical protein